MSVLSIILIILTVVVFVLIISVIINFFVKHSQNADANVRQANELKRANDLKERELNIREKELKKKNRK